MPSGIFHTGVGCCLSELWQSRATDSINELLHTFFVQLTPFLGQGWINCKMQNITLARERLWRAYYSKLIEQQHYPKLVYKYLPINDNTLCALSKHSLWFSSINDYNDPYEGEIRLPKKIMDFAQDEYRIPYDSLNQLEKEYLDVFKSIQKDKIVCCFSKQPNNILLWSHYGKSHTGICLVFDPAQDVDLFLTLTPVSYQREFEPLDVWEKPQDLVMQLFFRKSIDWKYEKEYRLLRSGKPSLIKYNSASLKSVIFGAKTKDEDIEAIRMILKATVEYKRTYLHDKSFKLRIRKI